MQNLRFLGLAFITFCGLAEVNKAQGKMVALQTIEASKVIAHFEKLSQKPTLSAEESERIELVRFAHYDLGVTGYTYHSHDPAYLDRFGIIQTISKHMNSFLRWNHKLPEAAIKSITSKQEALKKSFGPDSYEFAWILNQLGQKLETRSALVSAFEAEYKTIMSLTVAKFRLHRGPLGEITPIYEALYPMSSPEEKKLLDSSMQQAKQHVSNLPDGNINT